MRRTRHWSTLALRLHALTGGIHVQVAQRRIRGIMKTKTILVLMAMASLLGWSADVTGAEKKTEAWVKQRVFQVASQYASAISCETNTDMKYVVTLIPWKAPYNMDEREDARYALVWHGDIGCEGGTGSYNPYIAIVRIGTGDNFLVDPSLSSPAVDFEVPVHSIDGIVKVTKTQLVLRALDWGKEDPHCCPSVPVQIILRQDGKGNWKLVEKKRVGR